MMTKQERIAQLKKYIQDARDQYVNLYNHRKSLLKTLESFPPYVYLREKYPEMPQSYEEYLKVRMEDGDSDSLGEWNHLFQWMMNTAILEERYICLEPTISVLTQSLQYVEEMGEDNPLFDLPEFYSDFLGALQIGLTSEQLQEFLD